MGHFFVFFSPSITQLIPCLYIAKFCNSFRCKDTIHFIHESHQYFGKRIIKVSLERPTFIFTITHPGRSKNIHTIVYINFSWLISLPIFKSIDLTIKRIPTTAANFPLARSKYTDLSRGWVQVTVEWIGNRCILYVVVFFIFCCCCCYFERDSKFTAKMRCYSQCYVAAPPRETSVQCIVTEAHQVVRDRDRTVVG